MKPRIFLGSSAQQEKLLQALTRGLQDIADVDAWTTVFNPGVSTLNRLVELTREVDFAAFVFAQDDWTTKGASPDLASGQASPRDNVVSKRVCSVVRSASAARSSSTRTAPSSLVICSV